MSREDDDKQTFRKSENFRRADLMRELADFTIDWTRRFEEQVGSSPAGIVDAHMPDGDTGSERAAHDLHRPQRTNVHLDSPAMHAYARRRLRGRVFGMDEIFGEPAWDILLDLAAAREQGRNLPRGLCADDDSLAPCKDP